MRLYLVETRIHHHPPHDGSAMSLSTLWRELQNYPSLSPELRNVETLGLCRILNLWIHHDQYPYRSRNQLISY